MDGIVLTIGKFEGLHLGHQALITEVIRQAERAKMNAAVMVFEPYPYVFFSGEDYRPLFTNTERELLLHKFGIKHVIVQPFDAEFAALSPTEFCEKIFRHLNAKVVVVGEGYRFGCGREGTVELLQSQAANFGAAVQIVPAKTTSLNEGITISTSLLRRLLTGNELSEARQLQGFPFFVSGTTEKGRQLGRTLGFPTLNLYPNEAEKFLLPDGVYATRTTIDGVTHPSVTNIGLRPTVEKDSKKRSVETHLLNFTAIHFPELYEKNIKVEFLQFIRGEKKFASLDELKAQIALDTDAVRTISPYP